SSDLFAAVVGGRAVQGSVEGGAFEVAVDSAFPGVTDSAVQLHRGTGDPDRGFTGECFRHAHRPAAVRGAGGHGGRGGGDQLAGDGRLHQHVGTGVFYRLEGTDGAAELFTDPGIADGRIQH